MKPKPLKILLIASLVCLGIEGMADLAEAAIMTTPIQTITLPEQAGDFSAIRPVNKFDPSLGTLLSVSIFLSGNMNSQGVPGFPFNSSIFCVTGGGNCRGSLTGQSTLSVSLSNTLLAVVVPLTTQTFNLQDGQTTPVIPQQNQMTTPGFLTYTDAQLLNQFIGSGQVNLSMTADAQTILATSGSVAAPLLVRSSSTGQIFYTYEPPPEIPEPSVLLGLGTISLLGFLTLKPKK